MKMGDIATKLGEVRLDDMRGFGGMFVDKEALWKLIFSYSVNAEGEEVAPNWVENLFRQLTEPPVHPPSYTIPSKTVISGMAGGPIEINGIPFGYAVTDAKTGEPVEIYPL